MTYKAKFFHPLRVTRDAQAAAGDHDTGALSELMANPEYLRHSSAIINEALKEGFDVLQLPNGDIVTTGTKIITNTYMWNAGTSKLVKARAAGEGAPKATRRKAKAEAVAEEEEAE